MGVYIRFAPLRGMEWDEKLEKLWLNDLPDANRKAAAGMSRA